MKRTTLAIAISTICSVSIGHATANAADANAPAVTETIEQISIIGSKAAINTTPGSGSYIDQETLNNYAITDINRVLAKAPGVYFIEEDGYGLRPNIGMRGNSADRSEKITVLEDGVLAAPAPYASPAAYYFPTIGRMSAIEILKGSSSVKYGPRTSGGVINLLSTETPDAPLAGKLDVALGSNAYRKLHAVIGGRSDSSGALAEVFHYGADGFKDLNSGQDTGFEKTDAMVKLDTYLGDKQQHHLEFKAKYSDETSNETYLGLVDADYAADAYQRYSASQLDVMNTEHTHVSLHYDYIISPKSDVSIIAYNNDFARNWYKTSKVGGLSLGSGAEEIAAQIDNGTYSDTALPEVQIKANNRSYSSQGIQGELAYRTGEHDIRFGLRLHEDDMDRYQWVDKYDLGTDQTLALTSAGIPGTDSNRIDSASATSLFIHDTWELANLTLKGGLRYEDVELTRHDWGTADPQRTEVPAFRSNSVAALLPALGMTYQFNDDWVVLAGVQRSFAPPAPGNQNAEKEDGWNAEAGVRFNDKDLRIEAIAFSTRLDNLHGNCTASQGCDDSLIGNQYNAGKVSIDGLELSLQQAWQLGAVQIPLNMNFTYSNASFEESFESDLDSWGSVTSGDDLPYLPQTVLQIETGVKGYNWQVLASVQRLDEMRTQAGSGAINADNGIAGRTVVNVSAQYSIDDTQQVYAVIDNAFDTTYIATRQHGAIQTGKPRTVQIGYRVNF